MTARQPFPKGANAVPNGNHDVSMAKGIIRPHRCVRFFCSRSRSPPKDRKRINRVGGFEAIASHLKNNVAKTPTETLLLNIGNGVFWSGRKETHGIHTRTRQGQYDGFWTGNPVASEVPSLSPGTRSNDPECTSGHPAVLGRWIQRNHTDLFREPTVRLEPTRTCNCRGVSSGALGC